MNYASEITGKVGNHSRLTQIKLSQPIGLIWIDDHGQSPHLDEPNVYSVREECSIKRLKLFLRLYTQPQGT